LENSPRAGAASPVRREKDTGKMAVAPANAPERRTNGRLTAPLATF